MSAQYEWGDAVYDLGNTKTAAHEHRPARQWGDAVHDLNNTATAEQ